MELVKFGKLKEQSYTMKESLRALKTNIQFCGDDIRTLLVTSSVPNEGKAPWHLIWRGRLQSQEIECFS